MEPASNPEPRPVAVAVAIGDFFLVERQVTKAAGGVHDDVAPAGSTIMDLASTRGLYRRLEEVVRLLDAAVAEADGSAPVTVVVRACYKVGRDVLVRLDRVMRLHDVPEGDARGVDAFRKAWPDDDVTALADRLRELAAQWKDIYPSFVA